MSPTLKIHVARDLVGEDVAGAAVANVYAFGPRGARNVTQDHRGLVIPAGRSEQLSIDVPVGRYLVEATLPSGDVVSHDVKVGEGEVSVVGLKGTPSPYEWLGFQQLLGNVPPPAPTRSSRRRRKSSATAEHREADTAGGTGADQGASLRAPVPPAPESPPSSDRRRKRGAASDRREPPIGHLRWIDHPVEALAGLGDGADAWELIASLVGKQDPYAGLAGPAQTQPDVLEPTMRDSRVQLYALGPGGPVQLGQSSVAGGAPTPRGYVLTESQAGWELGVLPTPWASLVSGADVPLEILLDRTALPGTFALAITPRDPKVASALGYMSSGSFLAAKEVFGQARDMLYGKMINPLAAAAGGYVLIATETTDEGTDWHDWIANLHHWFEWLPDGAILQGRLKLRHRRSDADILEARDALTTAYRRGLPYYSLGLQWLLEGLGMFATRDEEAAQMLERVRAVAWQVNLRQPFTTVCLSKP